MVTETWLSSKHCPPRKMSDLTIGSDINLIRRDRGKRGGGVCIAYNPTKIRLSKFANFSNNKNEIVCAIGNCSLTKRKLAFIAVLSSTSDEKS